MKRILGRKLVDPYDDWRYDFGGGIYKDIDGRWWRSVGFDRHNDREVRARLRRWRPTHLVRWLVFEWWIRRWY